MGTASYTKSSIVNFRNPLGLRNYTTSPLTILTGQNLVAGDVVGVVTSSGKAIKSLPGATDGSEVPVGIIHIATDASSADVDTEVVSSGEVDAEGLTANTWDALVLRLALQDRGIILYNSNKDSSEGVV